MGDKLRFIFSHSFLLAVIVIGFTQCSKGKNYPKEVITTLNEADSNASELKKVLNYYESDTENPLKYKAACFLISNMRNRFSAKVPGKIPPVITSSFAFIDSLTRATFFSGDDDSLFDLADYLNFHLDTSDFSPTEDIIDSLVKWKFGITENIKKRIKQFLQFRKISDSIRDHLLQTVNEIQPTMGPFMDAKHIKSDWLINHIENAFKMWHESPYAKNMNFDEFSETLLSYRTSEESLDLDIPADSCRKIFKNIVKINQSSIGECIRRLNLYIYSADVFEGEGQSLGYLGFYDVLQFYRYDCDRHSEWTAKILNASGVPAYVDFTTGFFTRDKMHYGVSVRDANGKYHHFTPKWQRIDDASHSKLFSKVFRIVFSDEKDCGFKLKQENEIMPQQLSDVHIRDVTELFHKVSDISIECNNLPVDLNLGYLAIFTAKGWKPIGWGEVNRIKNCVSFKMVPVDAMYIAGFYKNGIFSPFSQPFFVDQNGKISFINPDYQKQQDLHLTRKYPFKPNLVDSMKEMVGSQIEASNERDFRHVTTLYQLKLNDINDFGIKAINITNKNKFRYIKIVPPQGKMLNIALIEFFSKTRTCGIESQSNLPSVFSARDTLMRDTIDLIKLTTQFLPNSQNLSNAVDNNMESFICSPHLEIDLLAPHSIKQIRIAARNDNNGIIIGDQYKLFYYDNGWKKNGSKTAKYNYIDFKGLPTGTVYWLQNSSEGKEELFFTYGENGQVFINNP